MIRISILGATGYSGGELLRFLYNRPDVELVHLTSESAGGQPVSSVHPHLRRRVSLHFEPLDKNKIVRDSDVVFSCYPPGAGIGINSFLINKGCKVIDLSADFRLKSAGQYKQWYKHKPASSTLLKKAVYGLPELFRKDIKNASLIANPGCYATAAALSIAPLCQPWRIHSDSLIIDAKSGVSGAGKKVALGYIFSEVNENLQPYGVASHRHQPEIEQTVAILGGKKAMITFSPHLIPMHRGILSMTYATLKKPMTLSGIRSLFEEYYSGEPFIRILPEGDVPRTKNVVNTNYCDIALALDARLKRIIVMAAIDNLVKGAAGQAVQNMNLMFNRPETEGLL